MGSDTVDRDALNTARPRIAFAELLRRTHPVVVFLEMFPHQISLHMLKWLPADGRPARPQVTAVDSLIGERVEAVALALCPFTGEADVEAVVQDGDVDHTFEAALVVVAQFGTRHRFELVGRFGGGDVHHASRRIAPIERALRPAEHLQLANIEEFLFEEMVADERDVVQCHRNSRIGGD